MVIGCGPFRWNHGNTVDGSSGVVLSHVEQDADAPVIAAAVGPMVQRLVRVVAVALSGGAFLVAGIADVVGVSDGVPSIARWLGGLALAGLGYWAASLPLGDPATAQRKLQRVERYPVLLALLGGAFHVGIAPTPIISLFLLFVACFGALVVERRGAIAVVTSITLGVQVLATVRSPDPDWFTTAGFLVVAGLTILIARTASMGYRAAVADLVRARLAAERRADRLRIVAAAARDLHVLDPGALLASIADVAGRLGWDEVGISASAPAPSDAGHVQLGGTVAAPQPTGPLLADVARRGETVVGAEVWDDGTARHTVGAPLVVHGVLRGALVVGRIGTPPSEHEASLVELLADQAARAVELMEDHASDRLEAPEHREDPMGFLATVSHELRTPLHVVLGYAETVEERWADLNDERRLAMVVRLRHNARGLHHVIESMMDYSRLAAGAVEAHRTRFAMVPIVHEVIERLRDVESGHVIRLDATGALDGGIAWGDPLLVERVIENLVSNGVRHTPTGTVIDVVVAYQDGETRVTVRDDGPGIAPEDVARLGRRFYRARTERRTRGVGLGLAFSSEVLRLHGSALEVSSTLGEGSEFSFALHRTPVGATAAG